jgi:uncharacterized protein YdeI (YjbR/CyaY-like superfamily)
MMGATIMVGGEGTITGRQGALAWAPLLEPTDRRAWRAWLEAHHATASGVWLVWPRTGRLRPLDYEAAVEEALCFGWIDGQGAPLDELRSKQYFAPRRPVSAWSSLNRGRIQRLLDAGRVAPAGIAAVERARTDGSWSILAAAERLEVPADLAAALDARPPARRDWEALPPSARRARLSWIALARRAETRSRRVAAVAAGQAPTSSGSRARP